MRTRGVLPLHSARRNSSLGSRPPRDRAAAGGMPLDAGVTSDTFSGMKTISIKQLHARTGYWARRAAKTPFIVTDRGDKIASLQPVPPTTALRPVFTGRDWAKLPKLDFDSTAMISEERDDR